jgi:uncharacterized protein (TIRG00374 family)
LNKKLLNILKILFFLSLGILLIWLAIKDKTSTELNNIALAIKQADYAWVLLSIFISGLSHYFRALRWKILLAPLGHHPKTTTTFFAVMVGYLANLALPRLGEVTRCGTLNQYEKIPFTEGFGTVIAERALDLICLMLVFLITFAIEFKKIAGIANELIFKTAAIKFNLLLQQQVFLIITVSAVGIITFAVIYYRKKIRLLFSEKIKAFVKGLWDGLLSIKNINAPFSFIVNTIIIWLMYILQVYVCFFAFAETDTLSFVVAMVIMVFGSLGVIAVPGGTGAYQAIVIQILTSVYLISETNAFAFAWAVWASQIVLILILGLISLLMLPILNKNKAL